MGIETLLLGGLVLGSSYFSGKAQEKQAKQQAEIYAQQANALAEEGQVEALNKAQEVAALAGAQKTSFISSGITLEGTPENVLSSTYSEGLTDIKSIGKNYQTQVNNAISQANYQLKAGRSAFQSSMLSGVSSSIGSMYAMGGLGSLASSGSTVGVSSGLSIPKGATSLTGTVGNTSSSLPFIGI